MTFGGCITCYTFKIKDCLTNDFSSAFIWMNKQYEINLAVLTGTSLPIPVRSILLSRVRGTSTST